MKKMVFIVFLLVIAISSCNMLTNVPPNTPGSPNPINNATWVNLAITLTWTCSDQNGDPLTYDVYFGSNPNPTTKIGNGQSSASKFVGGLEYYTDYYWKVVAKDGRGGETSSPVWHFRTKPYVIIDDDFESRPVGVPNLPWANYVHSGNAYGVIWDFFGGTNRTLEFSDPDVPGYAYLLTPSGWPGLTKGLLQFDIYTEDGNGWTGVRTSNWNPYVGIGFINSELILFIDDYTTGRTKIMNVNTFTWYTIKIIFDYTAHEVDIYVNSVFKGKYDVNPSVLNLGSLQIIVFSDHECTFADYDNIKLYSYTPGWTPSPEFVEPVSLEVLSTLSSK
ncbi:MAG: hypothetical protein FXF54_06370 [Kosmotoga sp.]|nr:MAG: hypothetical protein FXF54_06370 [Kosmotoga sp.]